ncbi:MAG: hypothetical protein ACOYT8_01415 [Candidatus Dependentiae bacterium]
MLYKNSIRWLRWLTRFIYLQLFITLISLPILLCWGIPLSLASFLGNLFFAPFLSVILLIASFIFFFQLIGVSAAWLAGILEIIIAFWMRILSVGSNNWLIGFKQPIVIVLIIIVLGTLAIVHSRKIKNIYQGTIALSLFLLLIVGHLKWVQVPQVVTFSVPYKNKDLPVVYAESLALIVPNINFYPLSSLPKWIEYTLIPELVKNCGVMNLDCLIIIKNNNQEVNEFVELFKSYLTVKNVMVIRVLSDSIMVNNEPILNSDYEYHASDFVKIIIKKDAYSKLFEITLTIDNKTTTLYSPKLRTRTKFKQKGSIHESQKSFARHCL